jgi:hypothetical protein
VDTTIAATTYTLVHLLVDDKVIDTTNTDATYATLTTAGLITVTTTEGYAIPATAVCRALVYLTAGGSTFPTLSGSDRGTTANYIKGYSTNIYLAPVSAGAPLQSELWLRLQKCDWDTDLRVETLRQITVNKQGTSIYSRPPTFPLALTVNAEATEADWADWQSLMTNAHDGSGVYADLFSWNPALLKPSFAVVIESYDKTGNTLLQRYGFTDLRMEGVPEKANVGGRGTMNWSFKGTAFTLEGFDA